MNGHDSLLKICIILPLLLAGCDPAQPPAPAPTAPAATPATLAATATSNSANSAAAPSPASPAVPHKLDPPGSPPHLVFDQYEIDFGVISEVQHPSAQFNFTNIGGQTLVINQVKTSCGCTSAALSKNEYAPGESGHISVTYTPAGPTNDPKLINVLSNAQPDSFVRLTIRANVQAFLDFQPRIVQAGVLEYGKEHHLKATVDCPPDPNYTILEVSTTNPDLVATVLPATPGTTRRTIDITVKPTAKWGMLFSWMQVIARGKPSPDSQPMNHGSEIRIQGQLFGQLKADPDTFRFGVKPGEAFERHIRLRRINGQPFEILSSSVATSDIPNVILEVHRVSPDLYDIGIKAIGDQLRNLAQGSIAITTDVPGEEQISLPIVGVVRVDDPSVH